MSSVGTVVVVGLGEIGKPLLEVLSKHYKTLGVDIEPPREVPRVVDVMHVCFPFRIPDFIGETSRYIESFKPGVTILNSTVAVGTTRALAKRTGTPVVNSPVRGKHVRMAEDLLRYRKFVGAVDRDTAEVVARHFEGAGMSTTVLGSPEATEVAKLTETTYFGLMIAWAQEVERYCDLLGLNYDEVVSIFEEVPFFPPVKYFPGVIGGHCVLSNIEILGQTVSSDILRAIEESNHRKIERERRRSAEVEKRAKGGESVRSAMDSKPAETVRRM